MTIRYITEKERKEFDAVVGHPLQAYEWGEFREKTGVKVIRRGFFEKDPSISSGQKLISAFQLTIHKIPRTSYTIGYLPKGEMPTEEMVEELRRIGKEEKCIFIQLEPNVILNRHSGGVQNLSKNNKETLAILDSARMTELEMKPAAHPLFTKYTFVLDLTKSEDELLKAMHPKARYNIKVAVKHGVKVAEDNSDKAFEEYLRLTEETTTRQHFYAHTQKYHRDQWETLKSSILPERAARVEGSSTSSDKNMLTPHLFTATYEGKTLTTLLFFTFHDTLYYPYGASSNEHRNVMHSNLAMWEGIKFGKKLGLKKFDMWGAMGPDPDPKDPWYGFHNFKEKFGPEHLEFVGSYDLVINPVLYQLYKVADKLRWMMLKLRK